MKPLVLTFLLHFIICTNCSSKLTSENNSIISKDVIIDSIVVLKSAREMAVFSKKEKIKTFTIALGKTPIGKKQFEGDGKTPEGLYFIDNKSAVSKYHKNLNISYPNKDDIKNATASGKSAGGEIKIHGLPNGIHLENYVITDWTLGCIALTNDEIDELFQHIKLGSPILILP